MSRQPVARVRILKLANARPTAVRVEVGCPHGTTGLTQVPGPMLALTPAQMVTAAVYAHEERCGRCNTEWAHEYGDYRVREMTDRAWDDLLAAARRRHAVGTQH